MVKVIYRNNNGKNFTTYFNSPVPQTDWTIRKGRRFNPLTNSDQAYSPDYYLRMAQASNDPRTLPGHPECWRVRAVQIMLHQQTNYDLLVKRGLFTLPQDQIQTILKTWYQEIARRFPRYRTACEIEYARHLRKALKRADQAV